MKQIHIEAVEESLREAYVALGEVQTERVPEVNKVTAQHGMDY